MAFSLCVHVHSGGRVFGNRVERDEGEWDAANKSVVVYSGNSRLSLEPAYIFSSVCVCVFTYKNVHLN